MPKDKRLSKKKKKNQVSNMIKKQRKRKKKVTELADLRVISKNFLYLQ